MNEREHFCRIEQYVLFISLIHLAKANEATTFPRDCAFDDFFCSYNIHINKSEILVNIFLSFFLTYPDSYNGKYAYADQKKQRWKHPEMKFKDSKMNIRPRKNYCSQSN